MPFLFLLKLNCFANSEIEKAQKLAKEGKPELAIESLEKLMEVLSIETSTNAEANSIRLIKTKAIFELIDLAMHFEDYPSALAAIDFITKENKFRTMPINDMYTSEDIEILLYGILVNAKTYKKNKDENERTNYLKNINYLDNKIIFAISQSKNFSSWATKLKAYTKEANVIMGR